MIDLCVSFDTSLEILRIDNKAGAYGLLRPGVCQIHWKRFQREGWLRAMQVAQVEISRRLGGPLCPQEVCGELHYLSSRISLRHQPIVALGTREYTEWTEVALTNEPAMGQPTHRYFELCAADLPADIDVEHLQFAYAMSDQAILAAGSLQSLQAPGVTEFVGGGSCDPGEVRYRFSWPIHQLVPPYEDTIQEAEPGGLLDAIRWRGWSINGDNAVVADSFCGCQSCTTGQTSFVATVSDASQGVVCIEECGRCTSPYKQVRINYLTGVGCDNLSIDPSIEEAIVLYALTKTARSPIKPCGCDNTWVDYMLEIDPTAQTEFAHKLRYGPTNAGMAVMRTLDGYLERPEPYAEVQTGGLLTTSRLVTR